MVPVVFGDSKCVAFEVLELAEGVIEQPEKIDVTVADKMTKTQKLAIVLFDILAQL